MATKTTSLTMSDNLLASKSILARLLASEDIDVQHQPVETASFDVESRVLTLPMWDDMTNELYDMLVGHEVAHALFTPNGAKSLMRSIQSIDPDERTWNIVKSYLNIVEDARIERLMQDRFPGLVSDFRRGYDQLHKAGLFGDISDVNEMGLPDRINLHYKIGRIIAVPFSDIEQTFIDRIDVAQTWTEVVDIARDLYLLADFEEENNENNEENAPMEGDSMQGGSGNAPSSGAGSDDSGEDQQQGDGSADDDGTDDGADADSSPESGDDGGSSDDDSDASPSGDSGAAKTSSPMRSRPVTDDAMSAGLRDMAKRSFDQESNRNVPVTYGTIGDIDLKKTIIGEEIISKMIRQESGYDIIFEANAAAYLRDQQNVVNLMAKQFDLKKNARTTSRATIAKTGTLDTVKMMGYKFTDDIFRKNTIVPKGKNHGMLMFIDWSGSMHEQISDTIAQAINMAMFCKRAGIPFGVYAFTSSWVERDPKTGIKIDQPESVELNANKNKGEFVIGGDYFHLLELSTSNLKSHNYKNSLQNMIYLKDVFSNQAGARRGLHARTHVSSILKRELDLGGTPLDECIYSAGTLVKQMKKQGIEIVNCIFLTDGDGNGGPVNGYECRQYNAAGVPQKINNGRFVIRSGQKSIEVGITTKVAAFNWLRHTTGANIIGFYLSSMMPYGMRCGYEWTELAARFKEEKFLILPQTVASFHGYDTYYLLDPRIVTKQIDAYDNLGEDCSPAATRRAFIRQAKAKKTEKIIMTHFATTVAEA